jgi:hypothetical protein
MLHRELFNMHMEDYLNKVRHLASPWCNFRLDQDFFTSFEGYEKDQGIIRKIIYDAYPDNPSISLGSLPPLVSPMFWEAVSGMRREDIKSFTNKDAPITESAFDRYWSMYEYQRKIFKVYLLNPSAYVESLMAVCEKSEYTAPEIIEQLARRSNGLKMFGKSISEGEWPKLLFIVPVRHVKDKDISFTVTTHLDIAVYRNEVGKHHGHFSYYAKENRPSKKTWLRRWQQARDHYAMHRRDFPDSLVAPEDIPLFADECRRFNLNSVNLLQSILEGLRSRVDSCCQYKKESGYQIITEFRDNQTFYAQLNNVLSGMMQNNYYSVRIYNQEIKAKEITMGDRYENIHNSTIINRSVLDNSFNKVKKDFDDNIAESLLKIGSIIEGSGNKEAGELFNSFNYEISKKEPSKVTLKSLWNGLVGMLPSIETSVNLVEQISKLFS